MEFVKAYDNKPRVRIYFNETGRTKQSLSAEADINNIMAQYVSTGNITNLNEKMQRYGYAPAVDFQEALGIVADAQTSFGELPSAVRKRFQNSPYEFLRYIEDPANKSELVQLGLAHLRESVEPNVAEGGEGDPPP